MDEYNPPGKTLGKGMLTLGWVMALVGLTYLFSTREEARYNPNQAVISSGEGGVTEVTLQSNAYHHYVASGEINNQTVVFLLDTGATDVAVPERLARKLGLKPGFRHNATTANGIVQVADTRIAELRLGAIVLRDVRASINPGMDGDEVLLGMSALKQLEFTQSGDTLTLRQRSPE